MLSKHQFAALVALLVGVKSNKELAAAVGVTERVVRPMMRSLCDRGLVRPTGKRGDKRQVPTHFTYSLTTAGRLQAERTDGSIA